MADWKQRYKAVVDISIISIALPVWATGELEDDRFGLDDDDDDNEVLHIVLSLLRGKEGWKGTAWHAFTLTFIGGEYYRDR